MKRTWEQHLYKEQIGRLALFILEKMFEDETSESDKILSGMEKVREIINYSLSLLIQELEGSKRREQTQTKEEVVILHKSCS